MGRLGEMRLPGLGNGVGGAVHRGEHTQSPGGHGFTGGSEPGAGKEESSKPGSPRHGPSDPHSHRGCPDPDSGRQEGGAKR